MELRTFLPLLRADLEGDGQIRTFCQDNFRADLVTQLAGDPEDMPEVVDAPTVYLTPGTRGRSSDFSRLVHTLQVWMVLKITRRGDGQTWDAFSAWSLVDQLANRVDQVVCACCNRNSVMVQPQSGDQPDHLAVPIMRAFLAYEIQIPDPLPVTR
jgi:hypothetical protein